MRRAWHRLRRRAVGSLHSGLRPSFREPTLFYCDLLRFWKLLQLAIAICAELLLDSVFSNLADITDDERRGHIAYFLERMFSLHREKNGRYYFRQNEHILAQWISDSTNKNAYPYSQLLNALNNERDETLKSFVSKINIASLLQNFSDSSVEYLYEWAKLLDRLAYAYDEKERETFSGLLKAPLSAKSQEVTIKSVGIFYYSMAEMFYLNENLILELLSNNIDKFQILCSNKIEEAIDVFDFDFRGPLIILFWTSRLKTFRQMRQGDL